MIPGFVTAYKDNNNYIHLYFYPGYENGNNIYELFDLNKIQVDYDKLEHPDGSIELLFKTDKLLQFNCTLIKKLTQEPINIIIKI